jgi:ketosteroid isomerase-like protein
MGWILAAMSQEDLDVVKAFFDAYNARDSEAVDRMLDPEAEITTLSTRAGMPDHWRQGTTDRYFEQLDQAWTNLRAEVEDYRELGECVVALGVLRGAGMSSHVEVARDFATVFVIRNSQILVLETYDNWDAGLEAARRGVGSRKASPEGQ